jgi:hypothetical protein
VDHIWISALCDKQGGLSDLSYCQRAGSRSASHAGGIEQLVNTGVASERTSLATAAGMTISPSSRDKGQIDSLPYSLVTHHGKRRKKIVHSASAAQLSSAPDLRVASRMDGSQRSHLVDCILHDNQVNRGGRVVKP